MEVSHLVMCDEHVMLSAFSLAGNIDLDTRGHAEWRMGTTVSYGNAFPVIINKGGQLEKLLLPIGIEASNPPAAPDPTADWFPEQRALIPMIRYRARLTSPSGIAQYKSVAACKENEIFFAAAHWYTTSDPRRPGAVQPAFTAAVGDRVAWATSELFVLTADNARTWLYPDEGTAPAKANEDLFSSDFRRELVSH
ncbi:MULTISPECIES: hypothetical protein [Alphaproteobacteria]|uniref:hypothetical protein n=1 Tax=Alphaproteobacteria TaxID=28211 RepID=UPI001B0621FA|nr:hypothetical protein [Maricaulis sp.]MBO6763769.1 hypothetical protein [Maricaulis sp.]